MPTEPLVKEIERAFPERPFTIELWDGSRIPSTNGGGPTFTARSEDALAYAVAAASSDLAGPTSPARSRSTTWTP
jgi:hypothetical protein